MKKLRLVNLGEVSLAPLETSRCPTASRFSVTKSIVCSLLEKSIHKVFEELTPFNVNLMSTGRMELKLVLINQRRQRKIWNSKKETNQQKESYLHFVVGSSSFNSVHNVVLTRYGTVILMGGSLNVNNYLF